MIKINDLNKTYRVNHVLKDLSVELEGPGVIAVLGPNGSGKTTLIKCLLGMVLPDSGAILFQGENIKGQFEYRSKIAYLSQIARFPDNLTPAELIQLMKEFKSGATREQVLIEIFNLKRELDKKMSSLSGGTRQKVNIVLALMHDDPVIILDEPSTGLDPLSLNELRKFIKRERDKGKLIIVTTHILSLAEQLADDVLFLLEGRVYFNGSIGELLLHEHEGSLESAIISILKNLK